MGDPLAYLCIREETYCGTLSIKSRGKGGHHLQRFLKGSFALLSGKTVHIDYQEDLLLFCRLEYLLLKPVVSRACLPVDVSGRPPMMIVDGAENIDRIVNRAFSTRYTEEVAFRKG